MQLALEWVTMYDHKAKSTTSGHTCQHCRVKNTEQKENGSAKMTSVDSLNNLELTLTPGEVQICLPMKTTALTDFT